MAEKGETTVAVLRVREKEGRVGAGRMEGQERTKEWLRELKRSEKHETCISLSITYALNPGIYTSGINARARLPARFAEQRALALSTYMQSTCIPANGSNTVQTSVVMARDRYPSRSFRATRCIPFDNRE